jgi:hypothetical protein
MQIILEFPIAQGEKLQPWADRIFDILSLLMEGV